MGVIRWEEPPSGRPRSNGWAEVAAELRDHLGEWAVVAEENETRVSTVAQAIKRATYPEFAPAGSFEATTRTIRDGKSRTFVVYARYVGGA